MAAGKKVRGSGGGKPPDKLSDDNGNEGAGRVDLRPLEWALVWQVEGGRPLHLVPSKESNFVCEVLDPVSLQHAGSDDSARNEFKFSKAEFNQGIRADLIRLIFLKLPLDRLKGDGADKRFRKRTAWPPDERINKQSNDDDPLQVDLTRSGVTIIGPEEECLSIKEKLNLRGVMDLDGSAIPQLKLKNCEISEGIDLRSAKLGPTSFEGSIFPVLRGEDVNVIGSLNLNGCGPKMSKAMRNRFPFAEHIVENREKTDDELFERNNSVDGKISGSISRLENCFVNLEAATIEGSLFLSGGTFTFEKSRSGRKIDVDGANTDDAEFIALRLDRTHVRDSVRMINSVVIGTVSARACDVGDNFMICGSRLLAHTDLTALDVEMCNIKGLLGMKLSTPDEKKRADCDNISDRRAPFVYNLVIGQVAGVGATIGELRIGGGVYIAKRHERRHWEAIHFPKANVSQSVTIGDYVDNPPLNDLCQIDGGIILAAANVGKNFEIHRLGKEPENRDQRHVFELLLGDEDKRSKHTEDFFSNFGVLSSDYNPAATDTLWLRAHGIKIDRRCYITASHFRNGPPEKSTREKGNGGRNGTIDLWKADIGTGFHITNDCTCSGSILLNNSDINHEVVIECKRVTADNTRNVMQVDKDKKSGEASEQTTSRGNKNELENAEIVAAIDLSESKVDGHVKIGNGKYENGDSDTGSETSLEEKMELCGGLTMEDSRVEGTVKIENIKFDLTSFWFRYVNAKAETRSRQGYLEAKRTAFNLRDMSAESELEIRGLKWILSETEGKNGQPTGYSDEDVAGTFRKAIHRIMSFKLRSGHILQRQFAVVDIRRMRCSALSDNCGSGWGFKHGILLRAAGLKFDQPEPRWRGRTDENEPDAEDFRATASATMSRDAQSRVAWIMKQHRWQFLEKGNGKFLWPLVLMGITFILLTWLFGWIASSAITVIAGMIFCFSDAGKYGRLLLSEDRSLVPQVYDEFALAYNRAGELQTARDILVERKNAENSRVFRKFFSAIYLSRWLPFLLAFFSGVFGFWAIDRILEIGWTSCIPIVEKWLMLAVTTLAAGWAILLLLAILRFPFRSTREIFSFVIQKSENRISALEATDDNNGGVDARTRLGLAKFEKMISELGDRIAKKLADHAAFKSIRVRRSIQFLVIFGVLAAVIYCLFGGDFFEMENSRNGISKAVFATLALGLIVIAFWPFIYGFVMLLFRYGFRYGTEPLNALITFALFVAMGSTIVHYGRTGHWAQSPDWFKLVTQDPEKNEDRTESNLHPKIALVLDVDYEPESPDETAGSVGVAKRRPASPNPQSQPTKDVEADSTDAAVREEASDPMMVSDRKREELEEKEYQVAAEDAIALPDAPAEQDRYGDTRIQGKAIFAKATPCNLNVSSILFAMDIFIPLIDLDQYDRCTVRNVPLEIADGKKETKQTSWEKVDGRNYEDEMQNPPWWWMPGEDPYMLWRIFKLVYELLGWIVTSLLILTISGVLRRDLER